MPWITLWPGLFVSPTQESASFPGVQNPVKYQSSTFGMQFYYFVRKSATPRSFLNYNLSVENVVANKKKEKQNACCFEYFMDNPFGISHD